MGRGAIIHQFIYIEQIANRYLIHPHPYEMREKRKPNAKQFQIFGSIAYAKKLKSLKKLDERSEKLYLNMLQIDIDYGILKKGK